MPEWRERVLAAAAAPPAAAGGITRRHRVSNGIGRADGAGIRVAAGVGYRRADRVGQLGEHEPVLGANLLTGRLRILGVAEPHERDRRVPAAEPLLHVR